MDLQFFFFFFSIFSLSKRALTLTPPLLAVNCNIPSSPNQANDHIQTLLANLTSGAPTNSLFTALNATFGQEPYTGLMQCRPGIGPENCALCAETARNTISNLCRNSNAVSAWFDGCYIEISPTNSPRHTNTSHHSCQGRTKNQDPARFQPALETLLLQLRADINIPTRRGFSQRQISYEATNPTINGSNNIYGLVECARSISTQECDCCIRQAIEELQLYCNGENGGLVINGQCLVRFDTNEFCHGNVGSAETTTTMGNFTTASEGEAHWCRKEAVVAYWSGGVVCFALVVLLAWLLRRAVLNGAKVGVFDFGETVGKNSGDGA